MKILWLSENGLRGEVSRNFENMRTEFSWIAASGGEHSHIGELPNLGDNSYDIAIIILPKREDILQQLSTYNGFDLIGQMKRVAKKIGWQQEGPVTYFQDYRVAIQVWWFSVLSKMDFLLVHNGNDAKYISGLFPEKKISINRTLMIEDAINKNELTTKHRSGIIIGGNLCQWYGGFDSFIVATEIDNNIFAPKMGRMPADETQIDGLQHLEYSTWTNWMNKLSTFKYAVHLMPTHAAGTFALNCAYLGTPCIGYKGLDTQEVCHTTLSIKNKDISTAKKLIKQLHNEKDFYNECSENAKKMYDIFYTEDRWKSRFFDFINDL